MNRICTAIGALSLLVGGPAIAGETDPGEPRTPETTQEPAKPVATVIERDEAGKATRVRVGEREYALCSESVQDRCINPRSAGFDWGTQPLDHWPGQTASSLKAEEMQASEETDQTGEKPAEPS